MLWGASRKPEFLGVKSGTIVRTWVSIQDHPTTHRGFAQGRTFKHIPILSIGVYEDRDLLPKQLIDMFVYKWYSFPCDSDIRTDCAAGDLDSLGRIKTGVRNGVVIQNEQLYEALSVQGRCRPAIFKRWGDLKAYDGSAVVSHLKSLNKLRMNQQGALSSYQSALGDLSALSSGFGGFPSKGKSISHVSRLSLHPARLEKRKDSEKSGEDGDEPIGQLDAIIRRRGITALCVALLLIPGCYLGSKFVDGDNKAVGRIVVGGCFGLFLGQPSVAVVERISLDLGLVAVIVARIHLC
jgi:hypothetical protein